MDEQTMSRLQAMLEAHCGLRAKRLEPLTKGGSTSSSLILHAEDGGQFLVKLMHTDDRWQAYLRTLDAISNLDPEMLQYEAGFLFQPGILCVVTAWTAGEDFSVRSMSSARLDRAACRLAERVRRLHALPVQEGGREYSVTDEIRSSIAFLEEHAVMLPHRELYVRYLQDSGNLPDADARRGYIHFDLHTKNMIQCGADSLCLIDWEIAGISDVWRDFVYAVCMHQAEEQEFWLLFLLHYFEDAVPDAFFPASRFYTVLFMLMLVRPNYQTGHIAQHCMLAEKLYDDYCGLKCAVPAWMQETAERLLSAKIGHREALTRLIGLIKEERSDIA